MYDVPYAIDEGDHHIKRRCGSGSNLLMFVMITLSIYMGRIFFNDYILMQKIELNVAPHNGG